MITKKQTPRETKTLEIAASRFVRAILAKDWASTSKLSLSQFHTITSVRPIGSSSRFEFKLGFDRSLIGVSYTNTLDVDNHCSAQIHH